MADPTDPDRLLPGEQTSMSSGNVEDMKHWVAVYSELCEFKDTLLTELHGQRSLVQDEGQFELDNDEKLLRSEADRLKRRLDYWKRQYEERRLA